MVQSRPDHNNGFLIPRGGFITYMPIASLVNEIVVFLGALGVLAAIFRSLQ
jgi:hypothetical protein